jgi:FkbM family methyltransferase
MKTEIESTREALLRSLDGNYKKAETFRKADGVNDFLKPGLKSRLLKVLLFPGAFVPFSIFYAWMHLELFLHINVRCKMLDSREISYLKKEQLRFCYFKCIPGTTEYKLTKYLIKNLNKEDVFYDIGANFGFYTYLALEFCKEVHSFDPQLKTFSLTENLNGDPRAFLNDIALSDNNGRAVLYLAGEESTLSKEVEASLGNKEVGAVEVETLTLKKYLENHVPPTFIKLDAEGAEREIILGGSEFIKKNLPTIAMEVWSGQAGHISKKAADLLIEFGYEPFYINLLGEIERVDGDLSERAAEDGLDGDNFIFKRRKSNL